MADRGCLRSVTCLDSHFCRVTCQAVQLIKEHSDLKASHNCYAYKVQSHALKSLSQGVIRSTTNPSTRTMVSPVELEGSRSLVPSNQKTLIVSAFSSPGVNCQSCSTITSSSARHFGGIKLGAGPLGRAYGDAARQCLRSTEIVVVRPTVRLLSKLRF